MKFLWVMKNGGVNDVIKKPFRYREKKKIKAKSGFYRGSKIYVNFETVYKNILTLKLGDGQVGSGSFPELDKLSALLEKL